MDYRHQLALASLVAALAACSSPPKQDIDENWPVVDILLTSQPDSNPHTCTFSSGRSCGNGKGVQTCPADDGCNWCGCGGDFGSATTPSCTLVACNSDAGTRPVGAPDWPRCRDQADCPTGHACLFDPGCNDPLGRCSSQQFYCPHDSPSHTVCNCSGVTETFTSLGCRPDRRYAHFGSCP